MHLLRHYSLLCCLSPPSVSLLSLSTPSPPLTPPLLPSPLPLCRCSVPPAGIVRTLLEVPHCAEQLVNADQPNSERKGSTLASAFKRVRNNQHLLSCILLRYVWCSVVSSAGSLLPLVRCSSPLTVDYRCPAWSASGLSCCTALNTGLFCSERTRQSFSLRP